jgi:hypothetical protein
MICTPHQILFGQSNKKNEMGGAPSTYGERGGGYKFLVGKRQFGRPRRRWEENIKMDLQEVGWGYGLDFSGTE